MEEYIEAVVGFVNVLLTLSWVYTFQKWVRKGKCLKAHPRQQYLINIITYIHIEAT